MYDFFLTTKMSDLQIHMLLHEAQHYGFKYMDYPETTFNPEARHIR